MSDLEIETRSGGSEPPDPVTDVVVHGLLAALAARERRTAPQPIARVVRRRFIHAVAAAALVLAAGLFAMLVGRTQTASAASVMSMAIAHAAGSGTRVYDAVIDPEGDGFGRRPIEGRVFLQGGPDPRMAANFGVGPLERLVRFGRDAEGAWLDTPTGTRRGADAAPMLAEWFGGLDDSVLRIDKVLERCSAGHDVRLTPAEGGNWRLEAVRRAGESAPIVEAEFLVRPADGAVVNAWIIIESLGGARAEISLKLNDDAIVTEADTRP
jgi:hypothetical protein